MKRKPSPVSEPESANDPSSTRKACPSTCCQEGVRLLGVLTPVGKVAYVQPPITISAAFVERAEALGHPERRFRFTGPCVEADCPQWTGAGCGIVDIAIQETPVGFPTDACSPGANNLPACGIRHSCRWYAQRGGLACAVCPTLVADTGGTMTYQSAEDITSKEV